METLCFKCGIYPRIGESSYCRECKRAEARRRYAEKGAKWVRCGRCKGPLECPSRPYCLLCQQAYTQERTEKRNAERKCACGAPVMKLKDNYVKWCEGCREKGRRDLECQRRLRRRLRIKENRVGRVSIAKLWAAFDGVCPLCCVAVTRENGNVDHIIPLSRGGPHTQENLQILCGPCNVRKDCMPPVAVVE